MCISNKEQLAMAYEVLHSLKGRAENYRRKIRKAIRDFRERETTKRHIIKDCGDSYIEFVELPDDITSEETADGYFKECLYCYYQPSQYDCTGQTFTDWYKLFKRNGKWCAYHGLALDI